VSQGIGPEFNTSKKKKSASHLNLLHIKMVNNLWHFCHWLMPSRWERPAIWAALLLGIGTTSICLDWINII
jgi:hypothetical protein